jgi:hypothetical protein
MLRKIKLCMVGLYTEANMCSGGRSAARAQQQRGCRWSGSYSAARSADIRIYWRPDFEAAFAALVEQPVGALIVSNDAFFNSMRERVVALAARHQIPAIYDRREIRRSWWSHLLWHVLAARGRYGSSPDSQPIRLRRATPPIRTPPVFGSDNSAIE